MFVRYPPCPVTFDASESKSIASFRLILCPYGTVYHHPGLLCVRNPLTHEYIRSANTTLHDTILEIVSETRVETVEEILHSPQASAFGKFNIAICRMPVYTP